MASVLPVFYPSFLVSVFVCARVRVQADYGLKSALSLLANALLLSYSPSPFKTLRQNLTKLPTLERNRVVKVGFRLPVLFLLFL